MIERLYVHNYRCFENFTLDLKGRPSSLVIGRNGSGKSTLRLALEALHRMCRSTMGARELLTEQDFTRRQLDLPIRFEVTVVLGKNRIEYSVSFKWSERYRLPCVEQEHFTVDGASLLSRQREAVTYPNGVTIPLDLPGVFLPILNGDYADGAVKRFREFFTSALVLSPIPAQMSGAAKGDRPVLRPDAANFSSWLNARLTIQPARYSEVIKPLQAVIPDLASFEFESVSEHVKQLRLQFERPEAGEPPPFSLDFDRLSDGEKCLFLSAAIVAFNRKEKPLFCFWDEPDNHLSLPEVGQFVTELRKSTSRHGQFIATSHHPETIRRFSDENTFVFTRNSHLEPTVVRPLTELPYGTDLVRALVRGEVI